MATFAGSLEVPQGRFAIVAARFNPFVVEKLVAGAQEGFQRNDISADRIDLVWVPGSFEIPLVAKRLAVSGGYLAVVCLGAVIKGESDHYDYVSQGATMGILQAGLETGVPVIFGVLTCQTVEQALDRAGGKAGNKGLDAAVAALEMADLLGRLPK